MAMRARHCPCGGAVYAICARTLWAGVAFCLGAGFTLGLLLR
jgi:hypothetical protein